MMNRVEYSINRGWLQTAWYPGGWWVRLWGRGLRCVDHRRMPPLFSERQGIGHYLHLGPWCLATIGRSGTAWKWAHGRDGTGCWVQGIQA